MSSDDRAGTGHNESPDPSSHATNIYDTEEAEDDWLDEETGDDMDFEPATDDSEDPEFFDTEEVIEAAYQGIPRFLIFRLSGKELTWAATDADDGLSGVEIEFAMDDDENQNYEQEGDETETETLQRTSRPTAGRGGAIQGSRFFEHFRDIPWLKQVKVSHASIMSLFGSSGLRDLFTTHRGNASGNPPLDDDDEEEDVYSGRRRRRTKGRSGRFPPVPSAEGQELMASGTFGDNEYYEDKLRKRRVRLARRLMYRELGCQPVTPSRTNKLISQVFCSSNIFLSSAHRTFLRI